MTEFLQLCDGKGIEESLYILKEKYPASEFAEFQQRLIKIKDKLFVDDEYKDYTEIDLSRKVSTLTLNVTRKCNLKCSYCFENDEYRKLGNMPFIIAKKAIDTFFTDKNSNWVIIFTGGEPILNFDLLKKVIEYIEEKELKVEYRIKTNATLLDEEKMNFLIKNNVKIQISLDGNEKAHNTHRKFANGNGSFQIVDEVINKLIEKNADNITISGTLTHQTTQYIDDCYAQLNSYQGIKNYVLKGVMPNSQQQYVFETDDYTFLYKSNLKNDKYLIQQGIKLIKGDKNYNVCGIGIWNISIDVDGNIYPCYRMCGDKQYVIGHLNSLKMSFKLPQELENIYLLENNIQCSKCYLIHVCKIGCYTDKLAYKYDKCMYPIKIVIEDILRNNLFTNGIYLSLDTI
jgi:uncharacterized protein